MNVLWITTSDTFYNSAGTSGTNTYNGVGWVASQQLELMHRNVCRLAIMFVSPDKNATKRIVDGVTYYPIVYAPGPLTKLKRYYVPGNKSLYERLLPQINEAIDDFRPDLIHVFGLECPLSDIAIGRKIPAIVHLQGLLSAYEPAFFPPGIGITEVRNNGSWLRESLIRNGFIHGYDVMKHGADRERYLFAHINNFMGRTHWDKAITSLYASPDAQYHHVDEVLRPEFYSAAPIKPREKIDTLQIVSTISQTIYKGLDMVLRTAIELDRCGLKYNWKVIGVQADSEYEKLVRRTLSIKSGQSITYLGRQSAHEIVDVLQNADVYVHPSYIDNSPNSLCEAQILGLPVIATNVGGVSSLIDDGRTGLLVPANEPQITAVRLKQLAHDASLRTKLSDAGRYEAMRRHDKTLIVDKIIDIYKSLVSDV